jgi:hypothetical protein
MHAFGDLIARQEVVGRAAAFGGSDTTGTASRGHVATV